MNLVRFAPALLLAAAIAAHAAPSKDWTVVELPTLGPDGGSARAVNNRGDVVGTSHLMPNYPHPVLWRDGVVIDLLADNPTYGVANAINDRGQVAGQQRHGAVIWHEGNTMSLAISGEPQDIDKSGAVAGMYWPSGDLAFGPQHGFYWKDGVLHDIGTLGNSPTAANGLNDRGVVVGYGTLPSSSTHHAVVWEKGVLRDLGTLGGTHSFATDINNRGVIVGTADAADGTYWMFTAGTSGGLAPVLQDATPAAINDRGAIVGNFRDGRPFLYEDGEVTNLLALPTLANGGWTAFAPLGLNDRGWIVGIGNRAGAAAGVPLLLVPPNGKP